MKPKRQPVPSCELVTEWEITQNVWRTSENLEFVISHAGMHREEQLIIKVNNISSVKWTAHDNTKYQFWFHKKMSEECQARSPAAEKWHVQ